MTTVADAFEAGIDAVLADNTLNRAGFVDAMQTVITTGLSNAEGNAFVDAVAVQYESIGLINNPTYNNLRGEIINEGKDTALKAYNDQAVAINALPEFEPVNNAAQLMDLREDRDQADAAITRCDDLIAAEPPGPVGRLVKEVLRDGKRQIREYKQSVRDQIRNLTGDPDS
jgi:hypothetical protein